MTITKIIKSNRETVITKDNSYSGFLQSMAYCYAQNELILKIVNYNNNALISFSMNIV